MTDMFTLINLFLIPWISAGIWLRSAKQNLSVSRLLLTVGVWVAVDSFACEVGQYILSRFLGIDLSTGEAKFAVIAFLTAIVLPFLAELFSKAFHPQMEIETRK